MKFGRFVLALPAVAVLATPVAAASSPDHARPALRSAIAPASSAATVDFFISAPGVEGPPTLAGGLMETFDTGQTCGSGSPIDKYAGSVLAIGTVSAGTGHLRVENACWAGAATTSATPMPLDNYVSIFDEPTTSAYPRDDKRQFAWPRGGSVVIDLAEPVNYLGMYWAAGSAGNQITFSSGGNAVATFNTGDVMNMLSGSTVSAIGGTVYQTDSYHGGRKGLWRNWSNPPIRDPEPYLYLSVVASTGTFDQITLVGAGFEFDNLAIGVSSGTFDATGMVGVPRTSYAITYDTQGGSYVADGSYTQGSAVTLPAAPTQAGFTFTGWYTEASGGTLLGTTYALAGTGNITIYAQWAPDETPGALPAPPPPSATSTPATVTPSTTEPDASTSLPDTGPTTAPTPDPGPAPSPTLPATGGGNSTRLVMIAALAMVVVGSLTRRRA